MARSWRRYLRVGSTYRGLATSILGGLLLLAAVLASGCVSSPPGYVLARGAQAPGFTLATTDGTPVTLSSFRGKAVVINFWAISCPPCRAEMATFETVYQVYKDRAVFLSVNATDSTADVRLFVAEYGLHWLFLRDPNGNVLYDYLVDSFPTNVFLDREGLISLVRIGGPLPQNIIEGGLQEALRGVR